MNALTITQASCADDYDPNSMPVAKARAFIHQFLQPMSGVVRVPIRDALGRVLAEDILSPVDVPSHRNSAMDGWARTDGPDQQNQLFRSHCARAG